MSQSSRQLLLGALLGIDALLDDPDQVHHVEQILLALEQQGRRGIGLYGYGLPKWLVTDDNRGLGGLINKLQDRNDPYGNEEKWSRRDWLHELKELQRKLRDVARPDASFLHGPLKYQKRRLAAADSTSWLERAAAARENLSRAEAAVDPDSIRSREAARRLLQTDIVLCRDDGPVLYSHHSAQDGVVIQAEIIPGPLSVNPESDTASVSLAPVPKELDGFRTLARSFTFQRNDTFVRGIEEGLQAAAELLESIGADGPGRAAANAKVRLAGLLCSETSLVDRSAGLAIALGTLQMLVPGLPSPKVPTAATGCLRRDERPQRAGGWLVETMQPQIVQAKARALAHDGVVQRLIAPIAPRQQKSFGSSPIDVAPVGNLSLFDVCSAVWGNDWTHAVEEIRRDALSQFGLEQAWPTEEWPGAITTGDGRPLVAPTRQAGELADIIKSRLHEGHGPDGPRPVVVCPPPGHARRTGRTFLVREVAQQLEGEEWRVLALRHTGLVPLTEDGVCRALDMCSPSAGEKAETLLVIDDLTWEDEDLGVRIDELLRDIADRARAVVLAVPAPRAETGTIPPYPRRDDLWKMPADRQTKISLVRSLAALLHPGDERDQIPKEVVSSLLTQARTDLSMLVALTGAACERRRQTGTWYFLGRDLLRGELFAECHAAVDRFLAVADRTAAEQSLGRLAVLSVFDIPVPKELLRDVDGGTLLEFGAVKYREGWTLPRFRALHALAKLTRNSAGISEEMTKQFHLKEVIYSLCDGRDQPTRHSSEFLLEILEKTKGWQHFPELIQFTSAKLVEWANAPSTPEPLQLLRLAEHLSRTKTGDTGHAKTVVATAAHVYFGNSAYEPPAAVISEILVRLRKHDKKWLLDRGERKAVDTLVRRTRKRLGRILQESPSLGQRMFLLRTLLRDARRETASAVQQHLGDCFDLPGPMTARRYTQILRALDDFDRRPPAGRRIRFHTIAPLRELAEGAEPDDLKTYLAWLALRERLATASRLDCAYAVMEGALVADGARVAPANPPVAPIPPAPSPVDGCRARLDGASAYDLVSGLGLLRRHAPTVGRTLRAELKTDISRVIRQEMLALESSPEALAALVADVSSAGKPLLEAVLYPPSRLPQRNFDAQLCDSMASAIRGSMRLDVCARLLSTTTGLDEQYGLSGSGFAAHLAGQLGQELFQQVLEDQGPQRTDLASQLLRALGRTDTAWFPAILARNEQYLCDMLCRSWTSDSAQLAIALVHVSRSTHGPDIVHTLAEDEEVAEAILERMRGMSQPDLLADFHRLALLLEGDLATRFSEDYEEVLRDSFGIHNKESLLKQLHAFQAVAPTLYRAKADPDISILATRTLDLLEAPQELAGARELAATADILMKTSPALLPRLSGIFKERVDEIIEISDESGIVDGIGLLEKAAALVPGEISRLSREERLRGIIRNWWRDAYGETNQTERLDLLNRIGRLAPQTAPAELWESLAADGWARSRPPVAEQALFLRGAVRQSPVTAATVGEGLVEHGLTGWLSRGVASDMHPGAVIAALLKIAGRSDLAHDVAMSIAASPGLGKLSATDLVRIVPPLAYASPQALLTAAAAVEGRLLEICHQTWSTDDQSLARDVGWLAFWLHRAGAPVDLPELPLAVRRIHDLPTRTWAAGWFRPRPWVDALLDTWAERNPGPPAAPGEASHSLAVLVRTGRGPARGDEHRWRHAFQATPAELLPLLHQLDTDPEARRAFSGELAALRTRLSTAAWAAAPSAHAALLLA
ncbi:hypothetical protein [Streptomyces sp. H51]|uniref:hypothetical protein n=1 Tax=Streptomyces sp. H51 TaxID=3111770 RepID=UPI002D778033|nr:hypothetical protein [Streptomyces sp. H51]